MRRWIDASDWAHVRVCPGRVWALMPVPWAPRSWLRKRGLLPAM